LRERRTINTKGIKQRGTLGGKIFKKEKRREKIFNYEYFRYGAFEVTPKKTI
jgi:hypothetical protein